MRDYVYIWSKRRRKMEFAREYFLDEVKSGFYVPGMVKRGWAAQLQVLSEVDRICRKYDIQYFAEWGTLLGAIRHQGFIPWDDDLDICMKRADYNRFIRVAKDELPEGFNFGNVYTDIGFTDLLSRVMNERTIRLDDEFLDKYNQFPYVAGLDIFPLDYIARDEETNNLQMEILNLIAAFANAFPPEEIEWGNAAGYIEQIEDMTGKKFDKTRPLQQQLLQLEDQMSGIVFPAESDYLTQMPLWMEGQTYKFPKEYYDEAIYVPFENMQIPVPKAYDEILKKKYGDYMRLVRDGGSHEYPFYVKQERLLYDRCKIKLKEYEYNPETVVKAVPKEVEKMDKDHKQKVVFIASIASHWDGYETLWRKLSAQDNMEVKVLVVPYYYRKFKGELFDIQFEIDKFPQEINAIDFRTIDIKSLGADVIYIQESADEYNYTMTIHPDYYSRELRKYTDKLIYIPWFEHDEISKNDGRAIKSMNSYCTVPGVVYADEVHVQSENMKKAFVDKLTGWAGEDTVEIWQGKIIAKELPIQEKRREERLKAVVVPKDWEEKFYKSNGDKKKIILYGNNASGLVENGEKTIEKLKRVFELFESKKDEIALIWRPHPKLADFTADNNPAIWGEYENIVSEYIEGNWGVYDSGEAVDMVVSVVDAYYGDAGEIAHQVSREGKPVMIQDVSV